MSDKPANRFEKAPRTVLAALYAVLALALCVGLFFLVKAVRDEAKRGVERYIVLRERRPSSDIPQSPPDGLVAVADGLVKQKYPFRADADGYIMPSAVHQKPDLTVVFLGGSTTECMYMQEEERFPYLAGRMLEQNLGLKVNALNGGNAGSNTLHCLLVLQGKVLPRRPRAVVLMECINDLNFLMTVGDYWTPHASRGIVFDKEYNPVKTFILTHLADRKPLAADREDEFAAQRGHEKVLDPAVVTALYRKNLEHFVFLCRQHGITPVLMTQFNRFTLKPEENLMRQMKGWAVDYPAYLRAYTALQDTLRAVAAEQNVALIDLDRLVPQTRQYMYDVVHLNSAGARLVAGIVAEHLARVLGPGAAK
ncbi:MAG: SGNH/GDSL hydrolase family protein [Humidesulfovibrio sp.]